MDVAHDQPAAAVDPGSPAAALGDLRVGARDVAGERSEGRGVEIALVVQAEVDVRVGGVVTAGTAPAEGDADDTVDRREALRERGEVEAVRDGAGGEGHSS